nr:hypothetical protein [Saprospiraceae bacterium]
MKSARILVYVIIAYVIAFLVWWSVLLLRTEQRSYDLQQELIELQIKEGLLAEDTNLKSIDSAFIRNKRMILMEGAVFLVLLLGGAFYILRLHQRQERFVELKRNFLLGTTHELRSPIAAVKLNLQTLIKKEISAPNKDLLLNNSVSEINRLNNLIDNILLASKIDAKEYSFQLEAVPLSNLVAKTLQEARATG